MTEQPLSQKAAQLGKQKDAALDDLLTLKARNRSNIETLKKDFEQVGVEREARNKENQEVKKLKARRAELQSKANELRKGVNEKISKLKAMGADNSSSIEKRIEQLDYLLHFEGSSPKREKEIAEEVNELSKKLKGSKEADELRKGLNTLRDQLHPILGEVEKVHSQLVEHARKSDEHHAKIVKLSAEIDSLHEKIGAGINELNAKLAALGQAREEYAEARHLISQRNQQEWEKQRSDYDRERSEEEREREREHAAVEALKRKRVDAVRERAKAVKEKFKSGGKLSFEEFQLLQFASE